MSGAEAVKTLNRSVRLPRMASMCVTAPMLEFQGAPNLRVHAATSQMGVKYSGDCGRRSELIPFFEWLGVGTDRMSNKHARLCQRHAIQTHATVQTDIRTSTRFLWCLSRVVPVHVYSYRARSFI